MERHQSGISRDGEGRWDWNLTSNRIHFSPRWVSLVGCEEHEVGNTQDAWLSRVHPEDLSRVSQGLDVHLANGAPEFDLPHRLLHKDGSYRWMSCRCVVQRNAAGRAMRVMGSHADVTADTVADSLTGLPNRLLLFEHLARSIERAKRYPGFHFALLLVDLDRPAGQATPTGPDAADPLLVAAARRMETCLRIGYSAASLRHDDLVARVQGDQFGILLDGLKEIGDATLVADRVLAELVAPFSSRERDVFLSPSIGIAVSATGYASAEAALRDADTAVHRAKQLGKARYEVFDTAILKSARAELQLEADFDGALERGEFRVFQQAIVSLVSNEIVGFEALARWQHPVLGLIAPDDFIPVAERTGFILPLGIWVLRDACVQLKAWQQRGLVSDDVWVSVNVSSLQILHPPLVDEISLVLNDTGLDARCLVLELTEGIAMEKPAEVRAVLMRLRMAGIRISVDDFGTGHSSLASLRQYPVDCLKVDRSFVRGIETRTDMGQILGTVTTMARQLGLQVVVEGIENEAQAALVQSLQCEYGQGYLFSRPLDHDRATILLQTGLPPRLASAAGTGTAPVPPGVHPSDTQRDTRGRQRLSWLLYAAAALVLVSSVALVARFPQGMRLPPSSGAAERPSAPVPGAPSPPSPLPVTANVAAKPPAVKRGPTSLRVVHQHRLGSCRGLLTVSRSGVAFAPDEAGEANDAFSFPYGRFVQDLTSDELTIKSSARTYRFKSAVVGAEDSGDDLPALVDSMARLR